MAAGICLVGATRPTRGPIVLNTLINHSKFSDMLEIASPDLFKVMPVKSLRTAAATLIKNRASSSRFEDALEARRKVDEAGAIELTESLEGFGPTQPEDGAAILQLYFAQVLGTEPFLLDLRRESFASSDERLLWSPAPYFVQFDSGFQAALADVYKGFYGEDDAQFRAGLRELGLSAVEDHFRRHFGEGSQREVTFEVEHFRETFMSIFEECRRQDIALHHNFIALGMALASLYEHLDALGAAYDVRAAFERADAARSD